MDNQHKHIKGYRDLSPEEIALMNRVKEQGELLGKLVQEMSHNPMLDEEMLREGRMHLKIGIMLLVRSIAQPTTF